MSTIRPKNDEGVAQHGGQKGRARDGLVIVPAEDVRQKGGGEAAGGQRDTRGDVDTDPDPPRPGGAEVGHVADAADEACQHGRGAGRHKNRQHQHTGGPELRLNRKGMAAHGCPPLSLRSRSPLLRKAYMMPPSMPKSTIGDHM